MAVKYLALFALVALGGCKTTGDVRNRTLLQQSTSTKTVQEIAGCIALKSASFRGLEVASAPIPNGIAVSHAMRVTGIKSVLSVYDVEDMGALRRVTLYDVGNGKKPVGPIASPMADCL